MLDFMRKKANSWVMTLIFSIIIFIFIANFGPWSGKAEPTISYAATVNGDVISMVELKMALNNQLRFFRQFQAGDLSEAHVKMLQKMVLEQLIGQQLLAQMASQSGMAIPDEMVMQTIKERFFDEKNPFSIDSYRQIVRNAFNMSEAQFESFLRKELLADASQKLIQSFASVSEFEAKEEFIKQNTQVDLEVIQINPKLFPVTASNDATITDFATKNQDKVKDYYNSNHEQFNQAKKVKARHILLKTKDKEDLEKAKAKAQLEEIRKEILEKKADFSQMATKHSMDGSAQKGGDLGFFNYADMVPEFSKVAFSLEKGQLSEIVETPFGYHLIMVDDIQPEKKISFDEAKNDIAKNLLVAEQQKILAQTDAKAILSQLKSGKNLAQLLKDKAVLSTSEAKVYGFETGLFAQSNSTIPKISKSSELKKIAFTLGKDQPFANEVIWENDKWYVLKLKDRKEANLADYDAKAKELKEKLQKQKERKLSQSFNDYLKHNAKIVYNPALGLNQNEESEEL